MLKTLVPAALACALVAWSARFQPDPLLVWNASGSAPIGLYALRPPQRLYVGELVAARPPNPLADWLDVRGYLPSGLPLLKHIAALSGQTVCRHNLTICVDGAVAAQAQNFDHGGRWLPDWQGCSLLRPGELFFLNPDQPASLDGRYFGVLSASIVIGRAIPLWTNKED